MPKEHAEAERDSVFDILYHDRARISSFNSQFDLNGDLSGLKQQEAAEDERGSSFQDSVGVSAVLAKGDSQETRSEREVGRRSAERTYDTTFSNSLKFLDSIDELGLLERDFSKARLGQFVSAKGRLSIIDLGALQSVWQSPAAQAAIEANAVEKGSEATTAQAAFQILPKLPHTAQAILHAEKRVIWSSLRSDGLITTASDLMLKYGTWITGEWTVIGILDAIPDADQTATPPSTPDFEGILAITATFASGIKQMLGRPAKAFGMTPLLIVREVGRPTSI